MRCQIVKGGGSGQSKTAVGTAILPVKNSGNSYISQVAIDLGFRPTIFFLSYTRYCNFLCESGTIALGNGSDLDMHVVFADTGVTLRDSYSGGRTVRYLAIG